eukprot:CAMPEP_0185810506 /NCGR_PEP_ID=MMETSP1322-20130828/6834_1 /TAXON_ID=265543 /ORGANISM="Minutocellus polymorphus, Strain RCC2270" /LENGTH=140 /DNA_ID=CAMNT_0028506823 /DNA_START=45 /DNA_END=467 /DNA_ORIENTATION=+
MASSTVDFQKHFAAFSSGDNRSCSYEDWIDALLTNTSQDAAASDTDASSATTSTDVLLDFEGAMSCKVIDPRYYAEDCPERQFWNEQVGADAESGRGEVAARPQSANDGSLTSESLADFMIDSPGAAGSTSVTGDLMSFD